MQEVALIAAISTNNCIGDDNKLLWHLPNDLRHFKTLTLNKPIIMGRKTFESIGKALPNRWNIVITRGAAIHLEVTTVSSIQEALLITRNEPQIFIIGGGEIYQQFYPYATHLYLTYVHTKIKGSVYFIDFPLNEWKQTSKEDFMHDEKHAYDYSFVTYTRI